MHRRRIYVDHTVFQSCMPAEAYSGEFVQRLCLLGVFHFLTISDFLVEALLRHVNKKNLPLFPKYWFGFKPENIDIYTDTVKYTPSKSMDCNLGFDTLNFFLPELIIFIIPHIDFQCKTSIGRRAVISTITLR